MSVCPAPKRRPALAPPRHPGEAAGFQRPAAGSPAGKRETTTCQLQRSQPFSRETEAKRGPELKRLTFSAQQMVVCCGGWHHRPQGSRSLLAGQGLGGWGAGFKSPQEGALKDVRAELCVSLRGLSKVKGSKRGSLSVCHRRPATRRGV